MELQALAETVITAEDRAPTPFGVYLFRANDPGADLARSVEQAVFLEYFGNTAEMLEAEYRPYEEASFFLCIVDHARRVPAGMLRVIEPSPAGLKSLTDFDRLWGVATPSLVGPSGLPLDVTSVWDVATLAVAAEYRSAASAGLISMALYQAINMLSVERGVEWAVAVMDLVVLDLINSAWHRPFAPITGAEPLSYLDSPASLPVFCEMADYRARLSFLDPATYAILFEGKGLESMVSGPDWQHRPDATEQIAAG